VGHEILVLFDPRHCTPGRASLLALFYECVDGKAPVGIASGAEGDAWSDLILTLYGLALSGGDIAGEGDEEVAGDALLDGDVRTSVLPTAVGQNWIHRELRNSSHFGNAAGDLAGDLVSHEGFGRLVCGRGVLGAGFGGLAESEEVDDIGLGKGRVGSVLRAQLIDGSLEAEADVVLLNGGGDREINDGLSHSGIDELDGAAGEEIAIAVEDDVTAAQVDAAKDDGFGSGSADLKASCSANAESAADEIYCIRGANGEIEPKVLGEALCWRGFYAARELADETAEIEPLCK
jgi:hypothetical protein